MLTEQQVSGGDAPVNVARSSASGSPLLFLHGVGRCWQTFLPLIPTLGCRWQIHGLDFRGHGLSQRTSGKYLVRDYVRDAVAVVRKEFREPVVLYGHSLGAMVAAATAAELPEQVRAVVLEDPPFETLGAEIKKTQFHSLFVAMRSVSGSSEPVAELARRLAKLKIDVPGKPEGVRLGELRDVTALRFSAACLRRVDPRVWDPILEGRWLEGYDRDALLRKIQCPVLLLQGDVAAGGMLSDAQADEVRGAIADCSHVRLERVGHAIHTMQCETALRFVTGFLESIALGLAM